MYVAFGEQLTSPMQKDRPGSMTRFSTVVTMGLNTLFQKGLSGFFIKQIVFFELQCFANRPVLLVDII